MILLSRRHLPLINYLFKSQAYLLSLIKKTDWYNIHPWKFSVLSSRAHNIKQVNRKGELYSNLSWRIQVPFFLCFCLLLGPWKDIHSTKWQERKAGVKKRVIYGPVLLTQGEASARTQSHRHIRKDWEMELISVWWCRRTSTGEHQEYLPHSRRASWMQIAQVPKWWLCERRATLGMAGLASSPHSQLETYWQL